jgi:phosphohistidine phosphatase
MKKLFIMRHAKANLGEANQKDFDRTLSERGKNDAAEMGRRLKKNGIKPELIITSPAIRALKTAKGVAKEIDYSEKNILLIQEIYDADISDVIQIIRNLDDKYSKVMLFGHNPTFTGLVGYLSNQFIDNIPTAGVVQINFDIPTWKQVKQQSGKFISFDFPKNQTS